MWQKLSSKVIFKHPRLTLLEDEVLLPNGHRTTYLKHAPGGRSAMVICRNAEGKILLQTEYSHPVETALYQFPGGALHPTETEAEGANRELAEEAGYHARILTLLGTYFPDNRRSNQIMTVFLGTNLEAKTLSGDIEEDIQSFWLTEAEINRLITTGAITNGSALAAWSLFKVH
jgi:ADP-ribose pyrophosphatase